MLQAGRLTFHRPSTGLAALLATAALVQPAGADSILELGADRFVIAPVVTVTTPVRGDLVVAGGTLDLSGETGGDLVAVGGHLRIGSPVRQNIYAAGGRIYLDAPVGGNARIAGGSLEIGPQGVVGGNLTVAGGELKLKGRVDGYLQVLGGRVFVDGPVAGDVHVSGGRVELGPRADITGRLSYASRDELSRSPGAQVRGGIESRRLPPRADFAPTPARAMGGAGWLWTLGLLLIAALVAAVLPGFSSRAGATLVQRWGLALALGFIAIVCLPVAALLSLLTVVGIPLGIVIMMSYPPMLLVGYVTAGVAAGHAVLQRTAAGRPPRAGWRIGASVAGMLMVSLLGRLPGIGSLLLLLALLAGFGTLVLQARASGRGKPAT